jgi:hypothetical protein
LSTPCSTTRTARSSPTTWSSWPSPTTPPVFTTVPVIETHAGWTYRYDAQATDPDGDPLTYSLLSGPQFMTVDPTTGQVNWLPAEADLGVHPVILHVHDGRGGRAEQRYFLSVTETPPNRPPYFVSVPVTRRDSAMNTYIMPNHPSLRRPRRSRKTDFRSKLAPRYWQPTAHYHF